MESWPTVGEDYAVSVDAVRRNLEGVRRVIASDDLDVLVVTSNDPFLNEYTPLPDNHRYHLSRFTGSTALMLVPRQGRARLFVDGRYHLQADLEVDAEFIRVEKVSFSGGLQATMLEQLGEFESAGFEGGRVSAGVEQEIRRRCRRAFSYDAGEIRAALGLGAVDYGKPIEAVDPSVSGRGPKRKLEEVFARVDRPDETLILLNALDDIAWLTDARGYHFPYQSSYAGFGFCTQDEVHVCVDPVTASSMPNPPEGVVYHVDSPAEVLGSANFDDIRVVSYDKGQVTSSFLRAVTATRSSWQTVARRNPVVATKAIKSSAEIAHFESINERSCRAVAKTIRWVRERLAAGEVVTEFDYYEAANGFYAGEGARDLSFHTIAAVAANSAVIHFSDPSPDVVAKPGDLMLLDSGGLYEGGIATDITRTFLAGGDNAHATDEQRTMYTLVLKGLLNASLAVFPEKTPGSFLDALARAPMFAHGFNYSHGTGHGVGIHVHEPGVGLSPSSSLPIEAGHVSSIEPGIYRPGFGGVRIENVVVYERHPEFEGYLRSRPLNYVSYDDHLVDGAMLATEERDAYEAYQAECSRRGT